MSSLPLPDSTVSFCIDASLLLDVRDCDQELTPDRWLIFFFLIIFTFKDSFCEIEHCP